MFICHLVVSAVSCVPTWLEQCLQMFSSTRCWTFVTCGPVLLTTCFVTKVIIFTVIKIGCVDSCEQESVFFFVSGQGEKTHSDFLWRKCKRQWRCQAHSVAPLADSFGKCLQQDSQRSYISSQLWPMCVEKLHRLTLINRAKHQEVKC